MFQFKTNNTFEKRKNEAMRIREKYPDRIPVIVEKSKNNNIPDIDKHKFLVPSDLTMGQFIYIIRKRLNIQPEQAIFIFINNTLPPSAEIISNIYKTSKDTDGFLYVLYSGESTFG